MTPPVQALGLPGHLAHHESQQADAAASSFKAWWVGGCLFTFFLSCLSYALRLKSDASDAKVHLKYIYITLYHFLLILNKIYILYKVTFCICCPEEVMTPHLSSI